MEKTLERHMDETFKLPGVAAVLCTDEHGLCLAAKGGAPKHAVGPIATVASQACALSPASTASGPASLACSPVVSIESEAGNVLIKNYDKLTMAVFKST